MSKSYRQRPRSIYGPWTPRGIQANRSQHAKSIDNALSAPIAKTTEQWMAHPNRYDLSGVDIPKFPISTLETEIITGTVTS
jgi:hypothetical protein